MSIYNQVYYGEKLSHYFSEMISAYPFIIELLDDEIVNAIYRLPTIVKIANKFLESKDVVETSAEDYSFLNRFSEMRMIIKKLKQIRKK